VKAEAMRSWMLRPCFSACTAALLAGCSVVLGDLPPTSEESSGSGGSDANGGSATGGGAGGTGQGGAGASSGTGGTPTNCDQDADGFRSDACEGGDDCNDVNDEVRPTQTGYRSEPHNQSRSFDYNCDRVTEKEGPVVVCLGVVAPCPTVQGFLDDVACGDEGRWGTCAEDTTGLACVEEVINDRQRRGCR
jgi:hypothetical protein